MISVNLNPKIYEKFSNLVPNNLISKIKLTNFIYLETTYYIYPV